MHGNSLFAGGVAGTAASAGALGALPFPGLGLV
jgi:hypothetical protein